jgi:hypothetical protein
MPLPREAPSSKAKRTAPQASFVVSFREQRYFFVSKSTFGAFISSVGMSNAAISFDEGYMTERQMRPGKVVISVL